MNNIITSQSITMTSREIADLLNSRHDSVKRTIERLTKDGVITFTPTVETNLQNKDVVIYNIGKRDSYIVVAQISPEFTAAIVDRWQELEDKQAPVELTDEQKLLAMAQGVIKLTAERDEAIKTKALINDKRTATLMNKASQDSKRIKKLENQIQSEGDHLSVIAAGLPQRVDTETKPNVQTWRLLKALSVKHGHDILKSTCPRYGEVNTYHIDVIQAFKDMYL